MEQQQETASMCDADWKACIEGRMKAMEEKQDENNLMTARIKEILEYADGFFKFCKGVGFVLKWVARICGYGTLIYGFFYAITHGGRQP